jgi:hypothetical protein
VQFTGEEQIKFSDSSINTSNYRLNFNHPIKYIAWVMKDKSESGSHGKFTGGSHDTATEWEAPLYSAKLQLNGRISWPLNCSVRETVYRKNTRYKHMPTIHASQEALETRS